MPLCSETPQHVSILRERAHNGAISASACLMDHSLPAFEKADVALLISAVEKALADLRNANERVGGNDEELLDYGRRYALILQKLNAVIGR